MLVLMRKENRKITFKLENGETITVTVIRIMKGDVKLGIEAPDSVSVVRDDAVKQKKE